MEPIIDLIWSVEEDEAVTIQGGDDSLSANCGGGCSGGTSCSSCSSCIACCSVPNIFTKWICN